MNRNVEENYTYASREWLRRIFHELFCMHRRHWFVDRIEWFSWQHHLQGLFLAIALPFVPFIKSKQKINKKNTKLKQILEQKQENRWFLMALVLFSQKYFQLKTLPLTCIFKKKNSFSLILILFRFFFSNLISVFRKQITIILFNLVTRTRTHTHTV